VTDESPSNPADRSRRVIDDAIPVVCLLAALLAGVPFFAAKIIGTLVWINRLKPEAAAW